MTAFAQRWPRAVAAGVAALLATASAHAPATERKTFQVSKANEAAALSIVAKSKADAGEFALAADLYRQAYRIYPQVPGYLYSAARCAHLGGLWARAAEDYEQFLAAVPASDPQHPKASAYLAEVRQTLAREAAAAEERDRQAALQREKQAAAERAQRAAEEAAKRAAQASQAPAPPPPTPKPPPPQRPAVPPTTWQRPVGYTTVATGIAGLGLGGYYLLRGLGEVDDLQSDLSKTDAQGHIVGVPRDTALARQATANRHQAAGGVLLGAGVGLAALGVYLVWTRPAVQVAVTPDAVLVGWRF